MPVHQSRSSSGVQRQELLQSPAQERRPDGDLRLRADAGALALLEAVNGWAWAPGKRYERSGLALSDPPAAVLQAAAGGAAAEGCGTAGRL